MINICTVIFLSLAAGFSSGILGQSDEICNNLLTFGDDHQEKRHVLHSDKVSCLTGVEHLVVK